MSLPSLTLETNADAPRPATDDGLLHAEVIEAPWLMPNGDRVWIAVNRLGRLAGVVVIEPGIDRTAAARHLWELARRAPRLVVTPADGFPAVMLPGEETL